MYFTLGEVMTLLLFGVACLYFLAATRIRELAISAVAAASKRDEFQLLDQSVSLQRFSLSRDPKGRWRIWRQYRFDYSYDGMERRQGNVMMLGKVLQAVVVGERPATVVH